MKSMKVTEKWLNHSKATEAQSDHVAKEKNHKDDGQLGSSKEDDLKSTIQSTTLLCGTIISFTPDSLCKTVHICNYNKNC